MLGIELFKEFSDEKLKQREEERDLLTANTDGHTYKRPTSHEVGKELIRLMADEIINWRGK